MNFTDADECDEKAAELLPCPGCKDSPYGVLHEPTCPSGYRPAVAAKLREAERERMGLVEYFKAEIRDEIDTRDYCSDQSCHCRLLASDIAQRLILPELG